MSRITAADLSYPVLTRKVGGGLRDLLDGAHRVAKSKQTGQPVHEIVVSRGLLRKAEVNETNKEIEGKQYASVGGRMIDVEKLWKLTKGMPSKPLDVSKIQWRLEKAPPEVMSALKERMKALDKKAALIGHISGISGSGKTTLAREIGALYPHLVVKDTDEFLDYAKARYPGMTMDDKVEHVNRLAKAFLRKHKDSPVLLAGGQTKKMDEIVDADKRWMINTGPGLSTWRKYRRLNERPWVGPIGERTESIWDIPKNYIQGWRKRSKIIGRGYQSMSADEIRQRVKDVLEKTAFLGFEDLPGRSGYEKHLRANLDVGKKWLREGKTTKGKIISLMHVLHGIVPHKLTSHETYGLGIEKKASFLGAFIDEIDKIAGSGAPKGHPDWKTFKKHSVPLTPEERAEVMKSKAVWHHGKRGAPTPAVSKAAAPGSGYRDDIIEMNN